MWAYSYWVGLYWAPSYWAQGVPSGGDFEPGVDTQLILGMVKVYKA